MIEIEKEFLKKLIDDRHFLHMNPELSGEEFATAEFIKEKLQEHNIKIIETNLKNGVVAEIGQGDKVVALRADIDALPIEEESGVAYHSKVKGKMHACGHDFHTISLIGAAILLKENEDELKGRVRLIFQPEEEINSGAVKMIEENVLEGVSCIIGFHNKPDIPVGFIGIKEGPLMAGVEQFEVEIRGVGTHAAAPHNGNDPIVTASQIITGLQSIVSRHISPLETAVVSVTKIEAGKTWNIIPDRVKLEGTIRTFSEKVREETKKLFEQIIKNYSAAVNQEAEIKWISDGSPVDNNEKMAEILKKEISKFAKVIEPEIMMGGDDFARYQEKVPGLYAFIGTGCPYEWHHPSFLIDDKALPYAINYFITGAKAMLETNEKLK
ncbi:amidohydrolase [Leptotrichia sp. oral taxon 221]|uniref:amidohydrolase n=1 Tax=Leptotrichia sp. oral taxon 221 TaxID=712362 RepID=UPI001B8DA9C9|nr:amidohydrolase [Leptotrichia sp. oral taxon 221]QUB96499.1 amidohydrolase [Leptotrichia sp. oral taxon 221]